MLTTWAPNQAVNPEMEKVVLAARRLVLIDGHTPGKLSLQRKAYESHL